MSTAIGNMTWLGTGVTTMHEVRGSSLTVDEYGFDVLTRRYEGSIPEFKKWRATLKRESKDSEFDYLYFTDLTANFTQGGIAEAEVTYKGTLDKSPKPIYESESKFSTLQISIGDRGVISLEYYAPVTTIRYIAHERPRKPNYPRQMIETKLDFRIINQRGQRGPIKIVGDPEATSTPFDAATSSGFFVAFGRVIVHPLKMKQIGAAWAVEEKNEGRLFDINFPSVTEE